MKIALMGSRGIPAGYGGFETLAEELGVRLAARGHAVTVYCRSTPGECEGNTYRDVRLIKLPAVRRKHLETISHTALSAIHALTEHYDIVLMFIAGNSPVSWIPRLVNQRVILHVDGLDWRRAKWGHMAQRYIRWCEGLAPVLPDAFITDTPVVAQYYRDRFGRSPDAVIAYGGDLSYVPPGDTLKRLGLERRSYLLFVGRLVPENCVHHMVEACRNLDHGFRCVIVGDASYEKEYISHLKRIAGPGTIFTGYMFGRSYRELSSNAYLVVEPSEVGGTHPAIVEAMGMGNCVVVNGIAENRETIGSAGIWYDGTQGTKALQTVLEKLIEAPGEVEQLRELARDRAGTKFQWDRIVDEYEALFERVLVRDRAARPLTPLTGQTPSRLHQLPAPARSGTVFPPAHAATAAQRPERMGS